MRLIEVNDIHFSYGKKVEALRGVSLQIEAGEFVALLGQNGSGKTTLAKHLNGLLKPSSGTVLVEGKDTRRARVAELSKVVGYVFQNPDHMIFAKTLLEEVSFGLENLGYPPDEFSQRATQALELIDLQKPLAEDPRSLSVGERRRLTIASVLVLDPKVLILDEPTTGVDFRRAIQLMDTVRRLHEAERTIIVITHDIALAAEYAQRTIILREGEVIADGPTRSILTNHELILQSNLLPPQVSLLARRLHHYGFPAETITIREAVDWMLTQTG